MALFEQDYRNHEAHHSAFWGMRDAFVGNHWRANSGIRRGSTDPQKRLSIPSTINHGPLQMGSIQQVPRRAGYWVRDLVGIRW